MYRQLLYRVRSNWVEPLGGMDFLRGVGLAFILLSPVLITLFFSFNKERFTTQVSWVRLQAYQQISHFHQDAPAPQAPVEEGGKSILEGKGDTGGHI